MGTTWHGIDIKTWLAITETAVKVLAALFAAVWAVFLLVYLRKRDLINQHIDKEKRALITEELKNKESDLNIRKLEIGIRSQIRVGVDIVVESEEHYETDPVLVFVKIDNQGSKAIILNWRGKDDSPEPPAFTVWAVNFDVNGDASYIKYKDFNVMSTKNPVIRAVSHIVRAGGAETLSFVFKPEKIGLYLLSFRAAADDEVRSEAAQYGVRLPTAWTAKRYVRVTDRPPLPVGHT